MEAEIIAIEKGKLKIEKQNGSTWTYRYRNELNKNTDLEPDLFERQKEGWKTLGIAKFSEIIGTKILTLYEVGM